MAQKVTQPEVMETITMDDMLKEIRLEIALRQKIMANASVKGAISQPEVTRGIQVLAAALNTLELLKKGMQKHGK